LQKKNSIIENPRKINDKYNLIKEFIKLTGYKINIQKSIVFAYLNKIQLEKESANVF
jgi:hypothetical protein